MHFAFPSRRGANLAKEALKVICTPKARRAILAGFKPEA
jgi:hypothetical protein